MSDSITLTKKVDGNVTTIRLEPFNGEKGASILVAIHRNGEPAGTEFLDYHNDADRAAGLTAWVEAIVKNDGYVLLDV